MSDARLALAQQLRSCARWQRFRLIYLSEHPLCEVCQRDGRRTCAATQVDHIRPLRWFALTTMADAAYDEDNVQAICTKCHGAKSAREQALDRTRRERMQ